MFVGTNPQGLPYPLYVGSTASLAEWLPNHERWLEAVLAGATQVHVRVEPLAAVRLRLELRDC